MGAADLAPFAFPATPDRFTPSFATTVPLLFPAAVRSRPPRAVAPWPPTLVIRPALSRVRRFVPLVAVRTPFFADPPPPPENRPLESRRYVLAIVRSVLMPQVSAPQLLTSPIPDPP